MFRRSVVSVNRADFKSDGTGLKCTDPQFWSLQVHQNSDGMPHFVLNGANSGVGGCMVFMRTVTEIEPEHVYARDMKLSDHVPGRASRTKGG